MGLQILHSFVPREDKSASRERAKSGALDKEKGKVDNTRVDVHLERHNT